MEELYNGIRLPDVWPPRNMDDMSLSELPVPYLENRPDVALIDVGRQLFVDDFLIEENWLEKRFHQAVLDETPRACARNADGVEQGRCTRRRAVYRRLLV